MTERIQACLDGKISRSELTPPELEELEALEETIRTSLAPVKEARLPDLTPSVMKRIRESVAGEREACRASEAPGKRSGVGTVLDAIVSWAWTPRTVRLRPAWALAGFVALALGIGVLPGPTAGPEGADPEVASASADRAVLFVRFELDAAQASSVALAGTFSDWQPRYRLTQTRPGHWTALVPLRPGVHEYAFVVDGGRWVADPHAPGVRDGFGGVNSQIALVQPGDPMDGRS